MTREQLMNELVKMVLWKDSNAHKVLKDLHQLYLLVGAIFVNKISNYFDNELFFATSQILSLFYYSLLCRGNIIIFKQ